MRNIIATLTLLVLVCACAKLTLNAVDKTIEQQDRADLIRCQNQDAGWVRACQRIQQISLHYETTPVAPSPQPIGQPLSAANY